MASDTILLELFDSLILSSLAQNVFTDQNPYLSAVNVGPLDFPNRNEHPHPDLVQKNVIPGPPSSKMHGPPQQTRQEIYTPDIPPSSIGDQESFERMTPPTILDRSTIYSLSTFPSEVPSNVDKQLLVQEDTKYSSNFKSISIDPPPQGDIRGSFEKGNLYDDREFAIGGKYAPIASRVPFGIAGGTDVFAIAHWLRNIFTEFGVNASKNPDDRSSRIAKFAAYSSIGLLMGTMNPGDPQVGGVANQIFNPLSFVLASVPVLRATAIPSPNAAAALSVTGEVYQNTFDKPKERLLMMRDGLYKKAANVSDLFKLDINQPPGFIGDIANSGKINSLGSLNVGGVSISSQVDQALPKTILQTNIYTTDKPYSLKNAVMPLDKIEEKVKSGFDPQTIKLNDLFLPRKFPGSKDVATDKQALTWVSKTPTTVGSDIKPFATPQDISVRTHVLEDPDTGLSDDMPAEDEMYMPFYFRDLRGGIDEFLYFRAFLKDGLTEGFVPEWQIERFYGRVDQIPIYLGVTRNIALSFDVVAWAPKDLPLMYRKLHKLQSMVYPLYDTKGFLQVAPLIRMRVGDLFAARNKQGLPGYITSLDFSYDDGVWNLTTDFKVPRKVSVNLGFNVLHEGNPGIYPKKVTFSSDNARATVDNNPTFGVGVQIEPGDFGAVEEDLRGVVGVTGKKK